MAEILVLYFSRYGATEQLAREICHGIDSVAGASARLRTVPVVSPLSVAVEDDIPESGPPYVSKTDLVECDGLVLGSPTRFGNMAAALKYFLDSTGAEWMKGSLIGKPGAVFTSTSSAHGGSESTLLSMALPLIHHGMIFVGLPYSESELTTTRSGGSPYGASHVTWNQSPDKLTDDEISLARALGARVATIAKKLLLDTV